MILRQLLLLVEPVGFVWLVLLVLTVLLWRKKCRGFAVTTGSLAAVLTLLGGTPLPGRLISALERPYAGVRIDDLPTADAIVMLGGGSSPALHEAAGFRLTRAGDRLVMGVELIRRGKAPVLVLGGAGTRLDGQFRLESEMVRDWITSWNLTSAPVIALDYCRNTREEAQRLRDLAPEHGWRRILLVSSACHMPRAAATFQRHGFEVIPVPCNFVSEFGTKRGGFSLGVPSASGFTLFSIWLHEQVGWHIYRRRGWL
ncbi:MAG TPA: YdcF family protein [Chthoniobacteraceae bacterium]|jgi:uncharacterized SAM-binding protein YcdF (DUF218 family)